MEEQIQATVPAEAPAPAPKAKKPLARKFRVVIYLAAILLILFLTNPTVIPFLPAFIAEPVQAFTNGIFGNMESVADMVNLDWSALFQMVMMVVIMLLLRELCNWLLEVYKPKTPRSATMKNLVASALKYILAFVAVFWALSILGVDVSTLFASVGVMALIIGFGAESLIADVITGLFMIFENQYNVGDIIELDGYRGTVVNIAIRTTSIEDGGGNVKIFNNSDVRNIINLSTDSSRAVCDFPVPYGTDLAAMEQTVLRLCQELRQEHPDMFPADPEYAGVQALANNCLTLRVVAVVDESDRFSAARIINKKIVAGLNLVSITGPVPPAPKV